MIIQAAEVILNKYDLRISNRYKLINYEEEDAVRNLKIGPDHFLEVTVPAVAVMLMGVIFVLLCARSEQLLEQSLDKVVKEGTFDVRELYKFPPFPNAEK